MQCLSNSFNTTKLRLFSDIKKDGTHSIDYDTILIVMYLLREMFHNILNCPSNQIMQYGKLPNVPHIYITRAGFRGLGVRVWGLGYRGLEKIDGSKNLSRRGRMYIINNFAIIIRLF
jgi:hypothetical protein